MGPKAIWREDMITSLLATALVAGLFLATAWHTAFGPESGVARVIAPFHLFLFVAAAALASAPLRSAWYAPGYYPSASSLRTILPPLISLTLVTCVAAFMFQWLNAFLDCTPSVTVGHVPADLARGTRIRGPTEIAGEGRHLVKHLNLLH